MAESNAASRREFLRTIAGVAGGLCLGAPGVSQYAPLVNQERAGKQRVFRFGVFSLFAPQHLGIWAEEPLLLRLDEAARTLSAGSGRLLLRAAESGCIEAVVAGETLLVRRIHAAATSGKAASFWLEAPPPSLHGTIRRKFRGAVHVAVTGHSLQPVVTMGSEAAVASIISAESPAGAAAEFLRAQAIVTRSFLFGSRAGHAGFDFCDTTHCQFLRELPGAGSPAMLATRETEGQVIVADGEVLAAMYSRSCPGRTHALAESGLAAGGYPYYSVRCEFCSEHPEQWERAAVADPAAHTERARLAYGRVHGWSALPSSSYVLHEGVLDGRGVGHGIGMCQRGAAAMALSGSPHEQIVAHYYPNTTIASRPA